MKLTPSQKTTVLKPETIEKKWYLVDVSGKPLGRTATKIANILRGKTKALFTPQHDYGDFVVVINAEKIHLSGNKLNTKLYHWHTGYGAGFKTRTAKQILEKKPGKILYDAVWGMLPRNKLRRHMMKKLRIFAGEVHEHTSQTPQPLEI